MKAQTIRVVLGEFFNSLQRLASSDDATLVDGFNKLPRELRDHMTVTTVSALTVLDQENQKRLTERVKQVQDALADVEAIQDNPVGQPIQLLDGTWAGATEEALVLYPDVAVAIENFAAREDSLDHIDN